MASRFSERLDFLMSLTNTTNSALARELSFDASYISRIRNGKRGMPLHQPFIEPAAAYLATRIREPYQIQTIEQALQVPHGWPQSPEHGAQLIARWLGDNSATLGKQFDQLFESLSNLNHRETASDFDRVIAQAHTATQDAQDSQETRYFIGNQGKRDATELFLSELIETGVPQKLLVYSDENLDWFVEDAAFGRRWMALLSQIIAAGGTITIVHTITRDIGEMLDAVRNWLPLYLTGAIASHYCPRIRDGICRRTLFVARGTSALTANSIENDTAAMASAIVTSPEAVEAYEREFDNLLALCKPLVKVMALSDGIPTEIQNASYAAANPKTEDQAKEYGLPVIKSARLPQDVIAFIDEDAGFTLAHLADPQIAMHVTERLMTAAFVEYLR